MFREQLRYRYKDHYNGVLQWGREIGVNSKYNKEKWGLVAKE